MKIARLNLSNVYWHWYDPPFTNAYDEVLTDPGVDMLAFQAEFIETLRMTEGGHQFAPVNTMSPAAYMRNQGFYGLLYYFDAIWGPTDDSLSDYRGNLEDARWLEKLLAEALTENPDWRLPSYEQNKPDRYVTNAANVDCQDFLITLMTGTHPQAASMAGVPLLYLDDMNLYRMSQSEMDGWERIIKEVQKTGQRVILNAGWNMKNWADKDSSEWNWPEDGAAWYYPAAEWLEDGSGVMCEYWVEHLTGIYTTSGWWELTQSRFEKMAGDMHDMGIDVYMVVRWSGEDAEHNQDTRGEDVEPTSYELERGEDVSPETRELQEAEVEQDYDEFMRPMADLAQSVGAIFCPSKYNYIDDPYEPWMAEYQDAKTFDQAIMDAADDRQTISGNWGAALQQVIVADGYFPVETEFQWRFEDVEYMVQKAEDKDEYAPRVYYAKMGDWGNIQKIDYPPKE